MSDLILICTVTCGAGSTAATIAGNPLKGDGVAPVVTAGAWLVVDMGGGLYAQVPVAEDATSDTALTLLHPLPAAVTAAAGWIALDPDKDSIAVATMQAVQTLRDRLTPSSIWFTGNGAPSTDIGRDGDLYRDYDESPPVEYRRNAGLWTVSPAATVQPWNGRGTWDSGTTYAIQDLVTYNGSSWLSRVDSNVGNTPNTASTQWQLVARAGDQILFGAGVPDVGLGVDGAAYVNTANGDLYKKAAGAWGSPVGSFQGPKGDTGDTGPIGPTGAKGDTGLKGDTGSTGATGTAGAKIFTGAGSPSAGTGVSGDLYLNTANGDVYQKSGGAWGSPTSNIIGPTGPSGGRWFEGTADPAGGTGADGDFYLQAGTGATGVLGDIWARAAGTWSKVANIRGASGAGTGDVVGPAGAATDSVVAFDGSSGKSIKTSGVAVSDLALLSSTQTFSGNNTFGGAVAFGSTATIATAPLNTRTTDLSNTAFVMQELDTLINALGTAASKNTGTGAGNVPVLDGSGLLDTSVLPAIAITDVFTVASQAAMLALTAQKGDIAIRSDLNKSFALSTNSPSTLADWKELLTPTDVVLAVAGLTGSISASALKAALAIAAADITDASANGRSLITAANYAAMKTLLALANVDNTADTAKPVSTAQQAAIDAKSDVTRSINAQTGTTYIFALTDAGDVVTLSNASAITATVPPNSSVAFPVGTQIDLQALGAGQVTLAAGSGVTINSEGGALKLNKQYSSGTLLKTATNVWTLSGSLA